jgi:hypothetical protein
LTLGDQHGDDRRVEPRESARRILRAGLVLVAAAVVLWDACFCCRSRWSRIQAHDLLRYRGADGREHVYFSDFDTTPRTRQPI